MKQILFTWVTPEGSAAWEAMSTEDRQAYIGRHHEWFARYAAAIEGGEELGPRSTNRVVRRGRKASKVTDGPFAETKEWIGGFIVIEVPDRATAEAMAADWPGLELPGHAVEIASTGMTRA